MVQSASQSGVSVIRESSPTYAVMSEPADYMMTAGSSSEHGIAHRASASCVLVSAFMEDNSAVSGVEKSYTVIAALMAFPEFESRSDRQKVSYTPDR